MVLNMKLNYSNIIGKHKGETCLILAFGPSLNRILDKLQTYKSKGIKTISCNDWYNFFSVQPDYWIIANSEMRMNNHYQKFNEYTIPLFYSKSADFSDENWVEQNIKCNYFPYCHNYQNKKSGEKENNEILQEYTHYNKRLTGGDTVAIQMLVFAIILGFSNIYVSGMDLNYRLGYANRITNSKVPPSGCLDEFLNRIKEHMTIIYESASNINTNIYNLSADNIVTRMFKKGELQI